MTLEEFEKIEPRLIEAFTEAIYEAACKDPESFAAWWEALSKGPPAEER